MTLLCKLRQGTRASGVLQNATMSVAPLSINADREEAVDFTKPFMTRYINVLMRLPRRETSYFEVSVTVASVHNTAYHDS